MDNVINEFVENAPIKGIKIKYGIYKNIDKNLSIATIYDYASMAAETVMEDYNHDYAYYTDELAQKRLYNQMIENDFTDALKNKELVHDEKSNSNYFIYGISNIAFCMWQKKRTVRDSRPVTVQDRLCRRFFESYKYCKWARVSGRIFL